MKKIIILLSLIGFNLFGLEIRPQMDCEDIKDIIPNVSNTKLLIQYQNNIICKAILEDEEGCLVIKYDLNYKKNTFEIIQNKNYLENKLNKYND